MARTPQDVTEKELLLLEVLWEEGSATIAQLADHLYPGFNTAQYATVQKLLERLEEKTYVLRERSGKAHTFAAAIERQELIGRRLRNVAERLCGGSVTPLLTHLLRTEKLSAEQRRELRDLIDELDQDEPR